MFTITAARIMQEVCSFLGLEQHDFSQVLTRRFNISPSTQVPQDARQILENFYSTPNRVLETLLQRKMHWS